MPWNPKNCTRQGYPKDLTTCILSIAAVARGACTGPQVNQATVDLVASFEGFRASVYTDATGHPTIGYGHLCQQRDCKEVHYPKPLSEADGKKLLSQDLWCKCLRCQILHPITKEETVCSAVHYLGHWSVRYR